MGLFVALVEALRVALGMAWETWWALVLGFTLTGVVGEFVSEDAMTSLLGDDDWETIGLATAFGAASSSCSYSATSTARVFVEKGASFTASLAFMFASTDLVIELGLVLWILLGWQFVAADVVGGVIAVVVVAGLVRRYVPDDWIDAAREHALALGDTRCAACNMDADPDAPDTVVTEVDGRPQYFCCGGCERAFVAAAEADTDELPDASASTAGGIGAAATDDASGAGPLVSAEGWKRAGRTAIREWDMLWHDIALGFLIAGALEAFVPQSAWLDLFTVVGSSGPTWVVASVVIATLVGVVTFLCSVGNVPFALVLWNNGIAFGGVLAFIYADLVIPPLVSAYRRYYGTRMAATIFVVLFVASVVAGIVIHYLFGFAGLIPPTGVTNGTAPDWYTLPLNLLFTGVFIAELYVTYGARHLATVALRVPEAGVTALTLTAMAAGFLAGGGRTLSDGAAAASALLDVVATRLRGCRDDLETWTDATRARVRAWD
ncbi:permease [Halobaculum limi]|uniref:permease n=1 Tax=Halobaculum limi TaxID=3031916 RepID=UPI002404D9D6|nr:permease [Halobaculum sp. YSMS11]